MAILIDPPAWPAHDTLFSHLVSDDSLTELHEFAARAGIPPRAFDRDHYDVAAHRYDDLVARGAEPVTAGTLIRRLRASGLRVPARDRAARAEQTLRRRWQDLLPGAPDLGERLIGWWSEPHRRYHDTTHLLAVLDTLDVLAAPVPRAVALAAWFHDAVYDGVTSADEAASATRAREELKAVGVPARVVDEVERLVLLTATHAPDDEDEAGALLCDADLAVLGREPAGYERYRQAVREEYAHIDDAGWRRGRRAVLERLLSLSPLFHSPVARSRFEAQARINLAAEHAALTTTAGETDDIHDTAGGSPS